MGQFHFHPDEYLRLMHAEMPAYDRPWAGVVPMCIQALEPVADARLRAGIAEPAYVRALVS